MRLTLILVFFSHLAFAQSKYVNPFIGTGGHGHTFPGATVPFGMVQLSPDTRIDGSWDGCSGYHFSDSFIYGFSHTHLSGTGVSDYGDILFLPSVNPISFEPKEYKTKFSHDDEITKANYYEVNLKENGVRVKLTTTLRTGVHEYSFEKNSGYVLLDLQHRDELLRHLIEPESSKKVVKGYRISKAWAKEQHCYYYASLSQPYTSILFNGDSSQAVMYFENIKDNVLQMEVGISFTSTDGAKKNLMHELEQRRNKNSFDTIVKAGQDAWDKELSKIEVFTKDEDKKHIFYTALYHCMIHPNIAEDADGKYRGHDMKIHDSPNHTHYTVFSLWDTYRALHPLMTIIDEQRTTDFINTFLEIYKQSGRLPVWELASNETDCMIGYHSVSVIADAYMKGIRGFDTTLALEAMVASANEDIFGLPSYRKYGFVRVEDESESVSKTLEYSYDDWCIAQMANAMGEDSIADVFSKRAESWRNVINPKTGFATPRLNGDWLPNFDPREVNNHFTEANSWQYSFVQHKSSFYFNQNEKRLDALFSEAEQTTGRAQSDITGLIGQYAHGNEPSHHIAYLYKYTNHPEKGYKIIKQICDSFYENSPAGLIGNEDCGQMSAWYVLSSIGIYQVVPGSNEFFTSNCLFDSVKCKLSNKTFKIYGGPIEDMNCCFPKEISWSQIQAGYLLISGSQSGYETIPEVWIVDQDDFGYCFSPLIKGKSIFKDETTIEIIPLEKEHKIYYWLNRENKEVKIYNGPILIDKTTEVFAYAEEYYMTYYSDDKEVDSLVQSPTISATFYKKPNNWTCTPSIQPNLQYTGGGVDALIDGINGTENWKAGRWQGYQHEEVTFDLDFKETKKINELSINFLQDARSWILMPSKILVYINDKLVATESLDVDAFKDGNFTLWVKLPLVDSRLKAKSYKTDKIKIVIHSAGKLPNGHPGHTMGGDSFFFVDEIVVE